MNSVLLQLAQVNKSVATADIADIGGFNPLMESGIHDVRIQSIGFSDNSNGAVSLYTVFVDEDGKTIGIYSPMVKKDDGSSAEDRQKDKNGNAMGGVVHYQHLISILGLEEPELTEEEVKLHDGSSKMVNNINVSDVTSVKIKIATVRDYFNNKVTTKLIRVYDESGFVVPETNLNLSEPMQIEVDEALCEDTDAYLEYKKDGGTTASKGNKDTQTDDEVKNTAGSTSNDLDGL